MTTHTNKQLIGELLPVLQKAKKESIPELDCKDYYGHKYHDRYHLATGIRVKWQEYGDTINLEAIKLLPFGRYDYASLSVRLNDASHLTYAKEYRGMGNGFYAAVDWNGKITESEWD